MNSRSFLAAVLAILLLPFFSLHAEIKLHGLFTDNMVLQRERPVSIWGWAEDGEEVMVRFRGQTQKTIARDGKWMVRLSKLTAGGPDDLEVSGKNAITLHNVLVGEVWIASGQSNMEWQMQSSFDSENEIPSAIHPLIRLYTVPKLRLEAPTNNVPGTWQECQPRSVSNFSAVAYYFARDLQHALHVPVGIIHTSWGGSPAEAWIREQVLAEHPDYKRDILDPYPAARQSNEIALAQWEKEKREAETASQPFNKFRPWTTWRPAELYNGMIAPLIPFAIKGAIWYQGESNAGRAWQYRTLFPDMIRNWRQDWAQGEFPFLLVQLAPFKEIKDQPGESDWAELREAQLYSSQVLPNVGMAVITDVGEEKDIHPREKGPVGARLALAARRIAYGEKITASGPRYRSLRVKNDHAILRFDDVGLGLEVRDVAENDLVKFQKDARPWLAYDLKTGRVLKPLVGFTVAGADRKFHWANATIDRDTIVVSSPEVEKPVAVRYGWADYPVVNLWNKNGLPASPFRTDEFPMITAPKKAQP